jgi:hypothetical protein
MYVAYSMPAVRVQAGLHQPYVFIPYVLTL